MSELAAVLRQHRTSHNPALGNALCDCGWSGPFTRCEGDASSHLVDVVLAWLSAKEPESDRTAPVSDSQADDVPEEVRP